MAINTNPVFEGFSGRVGDLVFRRRNGKTVVYAYNPRPIKSSPAMVKQQKKFKLVMRLLNPIRPFINQVNPERKREFTYNRIFSENIRNATSGDPLNPQIDYEKLKLSLGSVSQAVQIEVKPASDGKLVFNWDGKQPRLSALADDVAFVACYCEELRSWKYETNLGLRKNKTRVFPIEDFKGKEVHVYFGFKSARFEESSDSVYLGKIGVV